MRPQKAMGQALMFKREPGISRYSSGEYPQQLSHEVASECLNYSLCRG